MSAHLDLVRSIWEKGIFSPADWADPEIALDARALPSPTAGLYHGHEGIRQFLREWLESFENFHIQAESFREVGDSIIVGVLLTGRGKTSGAPVDMSRWYVYRIRNGLVIGVALFATEDEALEAARPQR